MKHGLTLYFEEQLKNNISGVPFTFKFDETTTKQVKKTVWWLLVLLVKIIWTSRKQISWKFVPCREFRKNCLKCFKVSVEYLLSYLLHNNKIIQYTQYLHPQGNKKRKKYLLKAKYLAKNIALPGKNSIKFTSKLAKNGKK